VFTGKIHTKICYLSLSLFISYNRHFCWCYPVSCTILLN
jgi:hypothetical protein